MPLAGQGGLAQGSPPHRYGLNRNAAGAPTRSRMRRRWQQPGDICKHVIERRS